MLNKNKRRFRSHTDINNYNNFLLELDKKNKQELPVSNNIKQFIKTLNNDFLNSNYKDTTFTGFNSREESMNSLSDPNLYETKNEKIIYNEKIKETVSYKKKVNIFSEINDISDLLHLIETYPDDKETEYNINISLY